MSDVKAPALFVSHGAPTFALEPGKLGPKLAEVGAELASIRALVVVSPHWQTRDIAVTAHPQPSTIYDFGGFSAELYRLTHPAPGDPNLAAELAELLSQAGYPVRLDYERGFDHGAWVPLRYLDPAARVPAIQLSLPLNIDARGALRLGRILAPLRDKNVAIVGSGSLTHNLFEFRAGEVESAVYAQAFAAWVAEVVRQRDIEKLKRYRELAPHAERAHPTEEHFLPLLVAVGATATNDSVEHIDGGMTYGTLSMDSYVWRAAQQ